MRTQASDAAGYEEDDAPRMTRRLDDIEQRPGNSDERIRELVTALGDPHHPQHAQSIFELVAIGPPAVSALGAALSPDQPWLTSYRAAEAIAQIGDGRASGALINALRHPNSNVRWSVVRALAEVGDTRTLWALRRVANEDRGKTSWGESVADTAQLALDRLQSRSALLRFTEPVKTALATVLMFAALLFAAERVQAVLAELRRDVPAPVVAASSTDPDSTAEAGEEGAGAAVEEATATTTTEPEATAAPTTTQGPAQIVGTVRAGTGNVRSAPSLGNNVIGLVNRGDQVIFLGVSGDWYLIRLGSTVAPTSRIRGEQGWVSRIVVDDPPQPVPTVQPGQRD